MVKIENKKKAIILIVIIVIASVLGISLTLMFAFPPTLKNLIIDFGDYDPITMRAGAFIFKENEDKVFLEFGAEVGGSGEGTKILPTFEYRVAPDANVYSPCDGFITRMFFQERTNDYEIGIRTNALSIYTVAIDHITNLTVSVGSFVRAGDIIGNPGTWQEGLGRTELSINVGAGGHYAPFLFFDPTLREEYENKVWQFMNDWEEFKGDQTIYDEENMPYAGCLYDFLDESQLE
jgi:hypothetical protein